MASMAKLVGFILCFVVVLKKQKTRQIQNQNKKTHTKKLPTNQTIKNPHNPKCNNKTNLTVIFLIGLDLCFQQVVFFLSISNGNIFILIRFLLKMLFRNNELPVKQTVLRLKWGYVCFLIMHTKILELKVINHGVFIIFSLLNYVYNHSTKYTTMQRKQLKMSREICNVKNVFIC